MSAQKKNSGVRTLRQPVEKIWLAGLGALALTEEEGSRLFKSLVKRGAGFEKETRTRLGDAVAATKAAPGNALVRVEEGVTDTLSGVFRRLGVPTRKEITSLTRRVEGLATTLEQRSVKPRRSVKRTRASATKRRRATTAPPAI